MSTPTLIGLGGYQEHGKDQTADFLVEDHGYVKMGMSEPLHEALLALNPDIRIRSTNPTEADHFWSYQMVIENYGYTAAKEIPEVRRLLRVLGTEVGRHMIDENVWVDLAEKKIRQHWAEGKSVALTGVRYHNEIEMVERLGTSVWVDRVGWKIPDTTHSSENTLNMADFDTVINNSSGLKWLRERVALLVPLVQQHRDLTAADESYMVALQGEGDDERPWPVYDH